MLSLSSCWQDLAKLPEENLDGDTKDAQIYKNLWIEAEASTCKLKYELQLARMKLATKNHSQQTGQYLCLCVCSKRPHTRIYPGTSEHSLTPLFK
jgi:hypothetical protein